MVEVQIAPGLSSTDPDVRFRPSLRALSEARRAWNRDRIGLAPYLRCECTKPTCRDRVPVVAETHRRGADQFVVAPAHFDDGVVVRAADRFFVIESRGQATRESPGAAGFPVADARSCSNA
jgi:hypothetical protein